MKTIILYKSKYGSALKYAQWLADELGAELAETGTLKVSQLADYDRIILGGSVFASGIRGAQWLKKNYPQLRDKQVAVFAVGASPYEENAVEKVRQHALAPELTELPFFYLRGRLDEKGMTWPDRKLCGVIKTQLEKKPADELVGWERALLEAYSPDSPAVLDWMSKDQLDPILEWAQGV